MNNNSSFENMLSKMGDMQVPIITVECIAEQYYSEYQMSNHIIVPDGMDKVTDFVFILRSGKDGDFLARVHSLDMDFRSAITEFSIKTLSSQGGVMKLYSN